MTEGTNPFATVSVWCGEASSATLRPALFERVSPSSNSSVQYDMASSVAQGSERAERRSHSLYASAGSTRHPQSSPVRNLGTGLTSGLGLRVGAGLHVPDYDRQVVWMLTVASERSPERLNCPPE
jgi:hypothetical protein